MANQNTLAFTIQGGGVSNLTPSIGIGYPATTLTPQTDIPNDYYWVVILNANDPGTLIKDYVMPGWANQSVPAGLDKFLTNPEVIFVVATKQLSLQHVPTGDWYDYLITYGASRELQRLNQLSTTLQPGVFTGAGYVLTGMGGPRGGSNVPPQSYELSTITKPATIVAMSLMGTNGKPPYFLIDSYTVNTKIPSNDSDASYGGQAAKAEA